MTEPCDLGAIEARRLIGARALSPVELLESCLARADAVNPAVNALVTIDRDAAMEAARAAERAVMAGGPLGLLHGLPLAVKDSEATAGMRTTQGSLVHASDVPEADDASTARVRAAGAVIFAKSNLPEFGTGANTRNRVFGATGNPFDPALTCAGSSGGSAVALAAGMAPVATGSDYGGSLRTPAGFCGVVGMRPSLGTVPGEGAPLSPWAVRGPMGRTVADAHLLMRAQAGHDLADPWSIEAPVPPAAPADLAALKIAVSPDLGCCPVSGAVRAVFAARMEGLAARLGRLEEAAPEADPRIHEVFEITRALSYSAELRELVATRRRDLDRNVIDNVERAKGYTLEDAAWAQGRQAAHYRRWHAFFERHDVLVAPAAAVSPFPHAELFPAEIDGEAMPTYMRWLGLVYVPTLAFACAAVVPCGRDGAGMPFGVQVIGPHRGDARVWAVAAALEAVFAESPETARPVPDIAALAAHPPMAAP